MLYEFQHPTSGEKIEVIQDINDNHVYIDESGLKWDRVFSNNIVPQGLAVDPFSSKQFVEKTRGKGTYGDLLDRSKEMSAMRAAKNGGIDPVLEKKNKDYADKRGGRKAPKNIKELAAII